MVDILREISSGIHIDPSGDIERLRVSYKDIIFTGLLGMNTDNPGLLIEELENYRKTH